MTRQSNKLIKPSAAAVIAYGRYCERVTGLRPPQKPQPFPEWLREWEVVQRIEAKEPAGPPVPRLWEVRNFDLSVAGDHDCYSKGKGTK